MKITPNNFYNVQSSTNNQKNVSQPSFASVMNTKGKNCDQIIISSKTKQVHSDSFVENLTNNISKEVRTNVSTDSIESLKNEIANGTYQVDLNEIANKMVD